MILQDGLMHILQIESEHPVIDFLQKGLMPTLHFKSEALTIAFPIAATLLIIAVSYLLGSINSAIIISKLVYQDDVRKYGSGNPGTTNMLRAFGKKAAFLTLIGDMLKTAISILFAALIFGFQYVGGVSTGDGMCYVAGLFAILGHVFPIYYKFNGGKGVLCTATMALILSPIAFLLVLLVFIATVAWTKYVSLGSVFGGVLYPVVLHGYFNYLGALINPKIAEGQVPFLQNGMISLVSIIAAILIVWCHRANLQRISDRTENKISFKKKLVDQKKEEEAEDDDEE